MAATTRAAQAEARIQEVFQSLPHGWWAQELVLSSAAVSSHACWQERKSKVVQLVLEVGLR